MESSLYILVPLSIALVFAIAAIFYWSVRSGQFDDLEGPAYRVLMDDDKADARQPDALPDETGPSTTEPPSNDSAPRIP